MKYLSWAIASLGVWVLLGSFINASWVGIVFGAIAAILAVMAALMGKEQSQYKVTTKQQSLAQTNSQWTAALANVRQTECRWGLLNRRLFAIIVKHSESKYGEKRGSKNGTKA